MSSRVRDLCNAIVTSLNETTFALPFEARFIYGPQHTLEELKDLHVTVTTRMTEHQLRTRGSTTRRITVDVAIQQLVDFEGEVDHDQVDALVQLTEAIADHFDMRVLTGASTYYWVETQLGPNLLPVQLREDHVYTGLVVLTYECTVAKA